MKVRLVPISSNRKTGAIPVSSTEVASCPKACPFNPADGGLPKCYAGFGNTAIHWRKIPEVTGGNVSNFADFVRKVKRLPKGQLWRHNEAGDLPHVNEKIDMASLASLINANKGKRGFTYTHHKLINHNVDLISEANTNGFTVNLSCNNLQEVDKKSKHGLPMVTLLPMDADNVTITPNGMKVVACPAEKSSKVTCATCGICAIPDRGYVIGFRAHGTSKKKADLIAKG